MAEGFWHRTSTIEWCEPKFVHSIYVAEFYNSLTSFVQILLPFVLYWEHPLMRDRELLLCLTTFFLGMGTLAFHAMNVVEGQLLDELSMISLIALYLWNLIELLHPTVKYRKLQILFLVFGTIFAFLHATFMIEHIFQCCVVTTIFTGSILQYKISKKIKFRDPSRKRLFHYYTNLFYLSFLIGALLWAIERATCKFWIGHALWHIGTGLGMYYNMKAVMLARDEVLETAKLETKEH